MPDAGGAVVRDKAAMLGPGPSAGAIEVHAAFHDAILKIKHPGGDIPGADRVSAIGFQDAVDHFQPGGLKRAERHLVPCPADGLLVCDRVRIAIDRETLRRVIKAITILDREVLQGDIAAPQVECGNAPVIFMIAAPGVPCQGEGEDGLGFVFSFEDDIVFLDEDLFFIDAFTDADEPWSDGNGGEAVEGFLDGTEVTVSGRVDDEMPWLRYRATSKQNKY